MCPPQTKLRGRLREPTTIPTRSSASSIPTSRALRDEARQAAAIGLAAASLRYDDRPGKLSVAAGGGFWRDSSALAFGAGYTSEDGRIRGNVSGTAAGGHVGVGAGISFTLN